LKPLAIITMSLFVMGVWAGSNADIHRAFELYGEVQSSLADDQFSEAISGSKRLAKHLEGLSSSQLDGDAQSAWKMHGGAVKTAAMAASQAADISQLRAAFKSLSDAMIGLGNKTGHMGFQRYHCPMAFANKGADWLQKGDKTMNPFYGKSMQQCGAMVETHKEQHGDHEHNH